MLYKLSFMTAFIVFYYIDELAYVLRLSAREMQDVV